MSAIANTLFSNLVTKRISENLGNTEFDLHTLTIGIEQLNNSIQQLVNITPKATIFLKSNNNNLSVDQAANAVMLQGPKVPLGYKGIIEDYNVNFTTAGGTVKFSVMTPSDTVYIDTNRNISSSSNGLGRTVLEEGQSLALIVQSQGVGVVSVLCTGTLQKVN